MFRKVLIGVLAGSLLIAGFGCAKKEDKTANQQQPADSSEQLASAKPLNGEEVSTKITQAIDKDFPGEWSVDGTNLKKGDYTENGSFKIADKVAEVYPGSMISIFIGEKRVSTSIKNNKDERVLDGYPTPEDVPATMKSGKLKVVSAGNMGSTNYQKIYLPIKAGDQTIAVLTASIPY